MAQLEPVAAMVEMHGACTPVTATFLPDAIEALIALGELDRAEALAAALAENGRLHDRPSVLAAACRCRALILAERGDAQGARTELERALAQHARVEMPLELGRSLLVSGRVERRARQKRAARDSLERAIGVFEAIGARVWAQRASAEFERTGVRHSGSDELTPTEARVAELAARGLTNRRIAEAVFLSPKTVEANLARIYRKLAIGSRAELGRAMAERERVTAAGR